ncbi:DUF177 domain-containing protein [Gluconacetobacter azotocaptans]|uniref:DUF177 domain-containing protein n=1 Tax=Gluconacetobacter azotocaptans TaxID=142834 RepID=A0A7W4JUS9_9PROT|nr:DUF177 domain-containing protein [Gluconacetobacter azotocaptans]MBB2191212.1 DUF177 domain-containing protein [Gluconacetobacter azotocaptans]MBM9402969.1 DUF177 domain-containing protein [Gluconacetobacter azotocaptans]GBQ36474.1 hypothetical protein AA13594_3305 [Gluconacetobacter azotocaptans DSM 13594]
MDAEFSRRIAVGRIALSGKDMTIEANRDECAALAVRLGLPAIRALSCRYRLTPGRQGEVLAEGWLTARVEQVCVITTDPFEDAMTEEFAARFVPAERFRADEDLDPEAMDEIPYERDMIDLGELAAEELSLILDPYPRRPGSVLPEGVGQVDAPPPAPEDGGAEDGGEDRTRRPFAALAALKKAVD